MNTSNELLFLKFMVELNLYVSCCAQYNKSEINKSYLLILFITLNVLFFRTRGHKYLPQLDWSLQ